MGFGYCDNCGNELTHRCDPIPSDERPDAGVLDTTGPDASTGSDETGRSDTVPRPHYHDDRRALNGYFDPTSDGRNYIYHIVNHHNVDKSANDIHPPHHNDRLDATAVYDPAPTASNDPKPVRDARAHYESTNQPRRRSPGRVKRD